MAACKDVKGYTVLGLGAEAPMLLRTVKDPQRKEVSDWMPFEPAWRISRDVRMKEVVADQGVRKGKLAESPRAAPGSLQHTEQGSNRRQGRGKPGHTPKTTEKQSDPGRSVLQSSKALLLWVCSCSERRVTGSQPGPH